MLEVNSLSYEDLAGEYYNAVRHPTCSNFRAASILLFSDWLLNLNFVDWTICEVGAGKSVTAEIFRNKNLKCKQLYITDSSNSMLSHSNQYQSQETKLVVAEAQSLPFLNETVDLIASSLGDPYNNPEFWAEVSRVLKPSGIVIFTTPAYEWSKSFRKCLHDNCKTTAEFELINGQKHFVPSFINTYIDQSKLLLKFNLKIKDYKIVNVENLTSDLISPKITANGNNRIVEGYLIEKY